MAAAATTPTAEERPVAELIAEAKNRITAALTAKGYQIEYLDEGAYAGPGGFSSTLDVTWQVLESGKLCEKILHDAEAERFWASKKYRGVFRVHEAHMCVLGPDGKHQQVQPMAGKEAKKTMETLLGPIPGWRDTCNCPKKTVQEVLLYCGECRTPEEEKQWKEWADKENAEYREEHVHDKLFGAALVKAADKIIEEKIAKIAEYITKSARTEADAKLTAVYDGLKELREMWQKQTALVEKFMEKQIEMNRLTQGVEAPPFIGEAAEEDKQPARKKRRAGGRVK